MNRRTMLGAAAALPLAPLAAVAAPDPDPALEAYAEWRRAIDRLENAVADDTTLEPSPETRAAEEDHWLTTVRACTTVATTPAGLAALLLVAFDMLGDLRFNGDRSNPNDYEFENWRDDVDGQLMRNILAAARALAARAA